MNKHHWIWIAVFLLVTGLLVTGYFWLFSNLPSIDNLYHQLNLPSVRIEDRSGKLLYDALPPEGGRNIIVSLDQIPLTLQQATIATEDQGFYTNPGVDLRGVLRALWINLQGGETIAGGSTITQQVARNLLLEQSERAERSLRRKLRETILAWQLTRHLSKEQILELYLNQTYYGGMAYGVGAASQTYFNQSVSELDLAEAALLAGLPQAPAIYNPYTDMAAAKQRQATVLELMEQQKYITSEQRTLAEREPLVLSDAPYPLEAPHFVMMVRSEIDSLFTPDEIYQYGGLIVRTTLNLDWQHQAERAIQRQIEALKRSPDGLGHNVNSAALVALDPVSGEILAMVGSPDYFDASNAGALNMAISPRQPGSAIKPILYSAALDPTSPQPWTPATMILDVNTSFTTHDGKAYTPANYDNQEHGPVLLRQALASSLNIPAVITLNHVGIQTMINQAARLGITTLSQPADYDLSLALGVGEVTLTELTAAYGVFANGGYRVVPQAILEVTDLQGNILYSPAAPSQVRVMDARVAWLISDILSDDAARSLGFGTGSVLNIGRPAAVKTGTTTNYHDNWTVGYTPDLVVGVWAGNTDQEAMRDVSGLTGAAPIWHEFMRTVLNGVEVHDFQQPEGLVRVEVCALSGLLPTSDCPYRREEWFISGTQPTAYDPIYHTVTINRLTGKIADGNTPLEYQSTTLALDLPPQAAHWAHAHNLTLLADLTADTGPSQSPLSSTPLILLSPPANSVYKITPNLPQDMQRIQLEAATDLEVQEVQFWIDGIQIATVNEPPFQAWWMLEPGSHQVWAQAVTQDGEMILTQPVSFEVVK